MAKSQYVPAYLKCLPSRQMSLRILILPLILIMAALSGCGFSAPSGVIETDPKESEARLLYQEAQREYSFAESEDELHAVMDGFQKVIELYPNSYHADLARFGLAHAYRFSLHDYQRALEELQALVQGDCDEKIRLISQYFVANTLNFGLHDEQRSIEEYRKFLETYPNSPLAKRAAEELDAILQTKQTHGTDNTILHQE